MLITIIIRIFIIVFKVGLRMIMFLVCVEYTVGFCLLLNDLQKKKKKKGQGENSPIHICDFH